MVYDSCGVSRLMSEGRNIAQFPFIGRVADQRLREMDTIRDLSQTLLEGFKQGDWENILALQAERDRALRACLKPPIEGEHAEATKAKIQELLRQNEAILEQVNAAKVRLLEEMRESQQHHRAVSAYLSSAR